MINRLALYYIEMYPPHPLIVKWLRIKDAVNKLGLNPDFSFYETSNLASFNGPIGWNKFPTIVVAMPNGVMLHPLYDLDDELYVLTHFGYNLEQIKQCLQEGKHYNDYNNDSIYQNDQDNQDNQDYQDNQDNQDNQNDIIVIDI